MKEKKTAVITFRTEEWVKNLLQKAADQNKWTIAQTVNELCKKFVANPHPETITVRTKDLHRIVGELIEEGEETGTEINIGIEADEENNTIKKALNFEVIECGGLGRIGAFDSLPDLTDEEIQEIP